ncbi:uncharacterized protein LOC105846090 [Hydra vulgaris]|uniref:uncharacterized protein LOC105846090 n=1 Tax=Hydra vulgaris TaxID=6087 RepID=UPI00064127EA|nr:uncharacterized protein LOC105846090 [Hydra vulgaris]XP_047129105.1 uncharacterized protein LOC105846090 [Hydra vulgaris]
MAEKDLAVKSLSHVLEFLKLPVLVEIVGDVRLCDELVLEDKKKMFILQRNVTQFLFGTELNGKKFRLNTCDQGNLFVDVFDEFYPKSLSEIKNLTPAYVLSKLPFNFESHVFERHSIFNFKHSEQFGDENFVFLTTQQGQTLPLTLKILLSKSFSFVCYVKTSTLEVLLKEGVESKIVRFRKECRNQVPSGIATLNELRVYHTLLTVSENKNCSELTYEEFQLDSRINVFVPKKAFFPKYIEALGDYSTVFYSENIKNIKLLIHHEIYYGQYYGYYHAKLYSDNTENIKLKRSKSLPSFEKPNKVYLKKRFAAIKKQFFIKKNRSVSS